MGKRMLRLSRYLKRILFPLSLVVIFIFIWIWIRQNEDFENCWARDKINCGIGDLLDVQNLSYDEPSETSYPILLLEGQFHDHLTPRMLCTVESAALIHPNATVYVFMTSHYIRLTPIIISVLQKYDNIKVVHLNASKLFTNSPLQNWYEEKRWESSSWPKSHFNDALRWLLIWKYGGIYLDLDIVVLKNLIQKKNFAGLESENWVGAGALGFTRKHPFIEECLRRMNQFFDGTVWGANGPELLSTTLKERCGLELPSGNIPKCPDIEIYSPKAFYSIPWWKWHLYLKEDPDLSKSLIEDPEVLAIHVWNFHLHEYPVNLYESNPYAVAAANFCPIVVYEVGNVF